MGHNHTGLPWSVSLPTADRPCARPTRWQRYKPRQTTMTATDTSVQNNTGPLSGPVKKGHIHLFRKINATVILTACQSHANRHTKWRPINCSLAFTCIAKSVVIAV